MYKKRFIARDEIEILKNCEKKFNFISDTSTPLSRLKLIHLIIAKVIETGEQIAIVHDTNNVSRFRVIAGKLLSKLFFSDHLKLNKHAIRHFNNRIYYKSINRLVCIVPDRVAVKDTTINLTLEQILENETTKFAYSPSVLTIENYEACDFKNIDYLQADALICNSYHRIIEKDFFRSNSVKWPESNIGFKELMLWFSVAPLFTKKLLDSETVDASLSEYSERSEVYTTLEKKAMKCGSVKMYSNRIDLELLPAKQQNFNLMAHILKIEQILNKHKSPEIMLPPPSQEPKSEAQDDIQRDCLTFGQNFQSSSEQNTSKMDLSSRKRNIEIMNGSSSLINYSENISKKARFVNNMKKSKSESSGLDSYSIEKTNLNTIQVRSEQLYSTILNNQMEYVDYDFLLNNFSDIDKINESESLRKIFQKIIIPYHCIMTQMFNSDSFRRQREKKDINIANEMVLAFD